MQLYWDTLRSRNTVTVYCQHNDSPCFYFDGRVSCVPVVLCVTDFSQLGGGSIQLLNTLWLFPPSLITVTTVRGQNETMSDTNHQFRAEHWFCWCFHVAGGFLWDWETTCDTETQLKRHSVKQFNTFRRLVAQIIQNKQMKSKVNTVSNVLTEFYSHCSVAVLISDVWKQREDCGNSWNPFGSITEHFPKTSQSPSTTQSVADSSLFLWIPSGTCRWPSRISDEHLREHLRTSNTLGTLEEPLNPVLQVKWKQTTTDSLHEPPTRPSRICNEHSKVCGRNPLRTSAAKSRTWKSNNHKKTLRTTKTTL